MHRLRIASNIRCIAHDFMLGPLRLIFTARPELLPFICKNSHSLDLLCLCYRKFQFAREYRARLYYLLPPSRSSETVPTFSFLQVSRGWRGPASGVALINLRQHLRVSQAAGL